jgi:hypothetical protein
MVNGLPWSNIARLENGINSIFILSPITDLLLSNE